MGVKGSGDVTVHLPHGQFWLSEDRRRVWVGRDTKDHPLPAPLPLILVFCTAKTSRSLIFPLHAMLAPIKSSFFPSEKAKLSPSP